jgi:hypothetical protein
MTRRAEDRFSGHESFVCRYGWLPKAYRAVQANPQILRGELEAMRALGIGRNMVKSLQFWAEASGVIEADGNGGHQAGPVGRLLFDIEGWDAHLETLESLWLVHWWLSTEASLAAWHEVFSIGRLQRFDKRQLVDLLAKRGQFNARALAASTLEQHAGILLQSYFQEERSIDDTSWCPLQDLGLLRAFRSEDGRVSYTATNRAPVGLTPRVFAVALVQFIERQESQQQVVSFSEVLRGHYSPGSVFKMDESALRQFIEQAIAGPLKSALRFNDTADTQTLVLSLEKVDRKLRLHAAEEAVANG